MIESHRKLIPTVPTDHITKQGIYASLERNGTSEEAKKSFRRAPFYKTVAEPKGYEGRCENESDAISDEEEEGRTSCERFDITT